MKKVIGIVNDNEWTDWNPISGDVIAIAFREILEGFEVGEGFLTYCRPRSTKYFSKEAREIHGFHYFKARQFPKPIEGINQAIKWLESRNFEGQIPFLYYGDGNVDWRHLFAHFSKEKSEYKLLKYFSPDNTESILKLARDNIKDIKPPINPVKANGKKATNYDLENVARHYDLNFNHHQCEQDALVSAHIYCNIKKGIKTYTGRLL